MRFQYSLTFVYTIGRDIFLYFLLFEKVKHIYYEVRDDKKLYFESFCKLKQVRSCFLFSYKLRRYTGSSFARKHKP